MPRVKNGSQSNAKRKKLFSITKGYWGRKKNVYRRAREAFLKSLSNAFRDRRAKKRQFRQLWIMRINAAARLNGMTYSTLVSGLKKAGIVINRKMLADLAVNDATVFADIAERAREALGR
ncbi:50S ribosomal protein L20 [Aminithiophilus ramosus]|uniref:Large ribosomal subunit protein bL20 n=2 Tax=Synergistales TaxID=649776 RepID=A0A9Q7AND2_9BACT|nr:50S ribosomal protein L20 [Aminithiophilus ramosus]QTX31341.1 50S ribosomal protein L20 [Aminithiophilus ramosus]QVL35140.1 50S ribosomal protein L20 [Synergistota bacterium]